MDTGRWRSGSPGAHRVGQPGLALVLALSVLTVLLLVAITLLTVGMTETQVAGTSSQEMQALHLADAMVDVGRLELQRRMDADTTKQDFDAELANSGYLQDASNNPLYGTATTFGNITINGQTYSSAVRAQVTDNNDETGTQNLADDLDKTVWLNVTSRVIIRGHTVTRRVKALVGPTSLSAFTMGCPTGTPSGQQTLLINGNPTIAGSQGNVHSNCSFTTTGNPSIAQDATAVDTLSLSPGTTVGGTTNGDAAVIPLPTVNPADFKSLANYVLRGDGKVYEQTSPGVLTLIYDAATGASSGTPAGNGDNWPSTDGWQWTDKSGSGGRRWQFSGSQVNSALENKAFYFEKVSGTTATNVSISGSPPAGAGTWKITLMAEGYIDISGNPNLRAADGKQNLLLVAGTDVKIGGTLVSTFVGGGVVAAHEQISISGNPTITGFFLAENAVHTESLVTTTGISGNPTITYNGAPSPPGSWRFPFRVLAWQQLL
jgi:Tfp pilus assembly protein PilX